MPFPTVEQLADSIESALKEDSVDTVKQLYFQIKGELADDNVGQGPVCLLVAACLLRNAAFSLAVATLFSEKEKEERGDG